MLCPQCGINVGDSVSLCPNCVRSRDLGAAGQSAQNSTPALSNKASPRRCTTTQINDLYMKTLGVSSSEQMFAYLSQPLPATILLIFGYLMLLAVMYFSFPKVSIPIVLLLSISATGLLVYLAFYFTILLDLFYIDRFAFAVCVFGLMSIPGVAFLYREEIGTKKLVTACAGWGVALVFSVLAAALSAGESDYSGLSLSFGARSPATVYYPDSSQRTFDQ